MFSITDSVTAAINILSAIDALETAHARTSADADMILLSDHEFDLLSEGIVNARYVLTSHGRPVPAILSLMAIRIASSDGLPRPKVDAVLRDLRAVELLAEGDTDPPATAIAA
ncbi:hypothetical protein [Microvirga sp. BSC39]|uniref:hypothetical protein n=1 Tax=Microvirga sp. BSC39 TaxID=1549810 RepID=UPI0004E87464|nr:hypothetical protein [Microvirga sp. BSC39]KFG69489.1 hypothetical protein JH26_10295 [Microvirga sp. BSC39]